MTVRTGRSAVLRLPYFLFDIPHSHWTWC